MPVTLYAHPQSPFCRSVAMTLDVLGVEFEEIFVDLFAGEQNKPEFLKVKWTNKSSQPQVKTLGFLQLNRVRNYGQLA